eukprot:TRINITY_DN7076_c1_g1_i1.p1 TRINITY_DN7076_c1_g1~~TRINITY_DN7076_c1_g1_i1.p1  ORF type:complete len:174 (-),score=16.16 TRINITY_DN7076_c1_g1_i1:7-528(-)
MKGNKEKHLIITPLSVLSNWVREFKKWCPSLDAITYYGDPTTRKEILEFHKFDVLVTAFEIAKCDQISLSKISWCYIIIDEGHRVKNQDILPTLQLCNSQRSLVLTGTPLQGNPQELWIYLNIILPQIYSVYDNFEDWRKKDSNSDNVLEEMCLMLRPFLLRRLKYDVERMHL